jgi:hypothetical protein
MTPRQSPEGRCPVIRVAGGHLQAIGLRVLGPRCDRATQVIRFFPSVTLFEALLVKSFQRPAAQHDDARVSEAFERAQRYRHAGAHGLFAPGLLDIRLIARLAAASPLPLNVMVQESTAPLKALADHGVARVSHGPRPYLLAMQALEAAARAASSS